MSMLSNSPLSKKLGVTVYRLRKRLENENYMKKVDGKWVLTDKGTKAGGEYRSYWGRYIVWPDDFKFDSGTIAKKTKVVHIKTFNFEAPNLIAAYYIYDYLPKKRGKQDDISKFLLRFKDNEEEAIDPLCNKAAKECQGVFQKIKIDSVIRVLGHKELKKGKTLTPLDKLGISVSKEIGSKYEPLSLSKTAKNQSLKFLSKTSREKQLEGLYVYKPLSNVLPSSILLIDDITTTGSTLTEVCRAVKESSPHTDVYFLALARTKRKNDGFRTSVDLSEFMDKLNEAVEASVLKLDKDKSKKSSKYHKKMEMIKSNHPNAYTRWTSTEEEKLKTLYRDGKNIIQITKILKRQPEGVRKRLKKLGLTQS